MNAGPVLPVQDVGAKLCWVCLDPVPARGESLAVLGSEEPMPNAEEHAFTIAETWGQRCNMQP